jgi:3-dehydroquinate synthetase
LDSQKHTSLLKKLKEPAKYLKQDKKRVGSGKVRFVFLQKPGKTLIQAVTVDEILEEIQRQSQV